MSVTSVFGRFAALAVTAVVVFAPVSALATVSNDWDGDGVPNASDCAPLDPAVAPGKPDKPDAAFEDTNCDGIDGDAADAIFVSVTGAAGGIGTKVIPFNSIQDGVDAAEASAPAKDVYVTGGNFDEAVHVTVDGVGIYGGYAPGTWSRAAANITTITGTPQALLVDGANRVVLQMLSLVGANTTGGASSYGLRAINAASVLASDVHANGGDVGPAPGGANGASGGTGGGNAGGFGGLGGCGVNVVGSPGTSGSGTNGGAAGQAGRPGSPGVTGSNGVAAALDGPEWTILLATNGTPGQPGGGGGGGTGGAGSTLLATTLCGGVGGRGGPGGAGGGGGRGGQNGGGSFGAYVYDATLVGDGSTFTGGQGGAGGKGGSGGSGGGGLLGGNGASGQCATEFGVTICAGNGFSGAPGAAGGSGGGGGAGGPSIGVYQSGATSAFVSKGGTETAGTPGTGGAQAVTGTVAPSGLAAADLQTATAPSDPVTDFDGDGVSDATDACPGIAAPGTGDGCPVRPPALRPDTVAPTATMTAPSAATSLPAKLHVAWKGRDVAASGSFASGVASYDVRYRKAPWNSGFGQYVRPAAWQRTTASTASLTGALGTMYCFSVRDRDGVGNLSAWSAERCSTRPLDDRSLTTSRGWTRATGKAYFNHTITRTTRKGAALTRTGVRRGSVSLVATRCSGCGTVAVYYGSKLVKTIRLTASKTQRQRIIALPKFSASRGTVRLKVKTAGKSVQIDGLLLPRR